MKNVLISGGSGLIGQALSEKLSSKGYGVKHLSRKERAGRKIPTYLWSIPDQFISPEALQDTDVIIHLAGAPINEKRWDARQKENILYSRVEGARALLQKAQEFNALPKVFISAGGVGYYGAVTSRKPFREEDPVGKDFLAKVSEAWEKSADAFRSVGARVVQLRTGLVLSAQSGALKKMSKMIQCYLGAPLGSGRQFMPWIHISDICQMYIAAIENENWQGPYNAVAPEQVTNETFTKQLARALNRPLLLPKVPAIALRLFYGELSNILLKGSPISVEKAVNSGFSFQYPDLESALRQIYPKGNMP